MFQIIGGFFLRRAPPKKQAWVVQDTDLIQNQIVPQSRKFKILLRVASFVVLAMVIGSILKQISVVMERSSQPAGFARGLLQGALMPMAFPNLLVGRDLTIYAQRNTGLTYKLGYTAGVNACGALFFGGAFWRWNRWRRVGGRRSEVRSPK